MEDLNWREKFKFHEELGFTGREFDLSRSLTKARGLLEMKLDLPDSELCALAGFDSERVMRERLKELELAAIGS